MKDKYVTLEQKQIRALVREYFATKLQHMVANNHSEMLTDALGVVLANRPGASELFQQEASAIARDLFDDAINLNAVGVSRNRKKVPTR